MIHSAHDICTTRICQAAQCERDAMLGWSLCERHDRQHKRGIKVALHDPPPQLERTLPCHDCKRWKTEREFPILTHDQENARGRKADRNGRYYRCNDCMAKDQVEET